MKRLKAPAELDDDALIEEVQDLIDEIGAGAETREYAMESEEFLDEEGKFDEDHRKTLGEILLVLRERQDKGDVLEEVDLDDLDDDLDDVIEGDEIEED